MCRNNFGNYNLIPALAGFLTLLSFWLYYVLYRKPFLYNLMVTQRELRSP